MLEIHAQTGKTMEGSMILVVEVSPSSTTSQDFSTVFEGSPGHEKIMSLDYSMWIRQWDPRELYSPMAATTCDYCWSGLLIFHGLLNFVFDRCKFLCRGKIWQQWMHISALRSRLFFKGWVLLGTWFGLSPTNVSNRGMGYID